MLWPIVKRSKGASSILMMRTFMCANTTKDLLSKSRHRISFLQHCRQHWNWWHRTLNKKTSRNSLPHQSHTLFLHLQWKHRSYFRFCSLRKLREIALGFEFFLKSVPSQTEFRTRHLAFYCNIRSWNGLLHWFSGLLLRESVALSCLK